MVNNSIGGEKTKKPINSGNRLQQLTEKASQTGSQPVQAGSGPRKCRTGSAEMCPEGEPCHCPCPLRSKSCMLPHRGLPADLDGVWVAMADAMTIPLDNTNAITQLPKKIC
jgi:hypothetical protein